MTEEEVKMIYMYCHNKSPDGLYPTEVDLIEFANKMESYLGVQRTIMRQAISECIDWYDSGDLEPFPIDHLRGLVHD
jgi:hypothetical protein